MINKSARNTNDKILEPDLCYKIQGAIYEVANKYGKGLKEIIYQKALTEELNKRGLNFEQQKRIKIYSLDSGKVLGAYVPDFVVEDKVVVEIKASSFTTKIDIEQQRSYLRTSIYEIGYLVNFSTPELDIRRSIYLELRNALNPSLRATERSEAIPYLSRKSRDCFVALLLAMTHRRIS